MKKFALLTILAVILAGCGAPQIACPIIDLADKTCKEVLIKYDDVDGGEGATKAVSKEKLIEALHNMEQDAGATE